MNLEPVRPSTWTELLEALYAGSWNPTLGRFRSPFAFRGQTLASEDLSSRLLARSGERQRAGAVPGAGWIEPVVDAVLRAETGATKDFATKDTKDTKDTKGKAI